MTARCLFAEAGRVSQQSAGGLPQTEAALARASQRSVAAMRAPGGGAQITVRRWRWTHVRSPPLGASRPVTALGASPMAARGMHAAARGMHSCEGAGLQSAGGRQHALGRGRDELGLARGLRLAVRSSGSEGPGLQRCEERSSVLPEHPLRHVGCTLRRCRASKRKRSPACSGPWPR